jgi:small conductance mechanosensitive channel
MAELLTTDFWLTTGNKLIRIAAILAIMSLALRSFRLVVSQLFIPKVGNKAFYFDEKRARTLSGLLQSIVRYSIYFIALILILQEFRVDTTSIIAGAGIVGLAFGIGAQSLIKDFVTGFFIILEDQYAVGEYVTIAEMTGTVEDLDFRVTKLRDAGGALHTIPHGTVLRVTNYSRGHMQAVINVPVPHEADLVTVLALLDEACREIGETLPEVLDGPKVVGVVEFRSNEIVVRLVAKTVPLEQIKVETALRQKIMLLFASAHILAPGQTQALN